MDINALKKIARAQVQQNAQERTEEEVASLNEKYSGKEYSFECNDQKMSGRFVSAQAEGRMPNSYTIKLAVPISLTAAGQAAIEDISGKRVMALAKTISQGTVNLVILETLAIP